MNFEISNSKRFEKCKRVVVVNATVPLAVWNVIEAKGGHALTVNPDVNSFFFLEYFNFYKSKPAHFARTGKNAKKQFCVTSTFNESQFDRTGD
jgi:hypothetical protein